ncbi:MAG: ferredoxin-thioredoxin reductase catalytic domain-containing protein [Sulfuricurvum sp.]|uniref:ferredoxin-thioredoxin reductase catalytic domain-containing protein n=1 Tax=Sulfuricurvum sp. TaxID=2025608 RepID=UPI0027198174|nr:ferredoxin-thioredoxin reductase catalytic domain-containing protein [Sulfuricurvum sp.]MDO9056293.1 ferredoxin-thioredoxin reductase catalytic domain-containing protein [Sulfuricurvum sp.]MDP2851598.1 ferredoxin-thioredoxin reductase catalytic domain-containing protein [Sulfuricurvum sp.]MDP3291978.1 ferredoxin-thioredoxin reductase catalytic domain-containing protein [Sulfuricurvum sp.]
MSGTITKIDPESLEFKTELEKTVKFTDKVCAQFGFVYNPDAEINQGIQFGLTRNKLMHGKRYCPCFFITGNKEEDRICPCKPALEHEIPEEGVCHCQIFCTPEFAASQAKSEEIEEIVHQHSRGLTREECQILLSKSDIDSDELTALFEARELGMVTFKVADVREWMEWKMGRIAGADVLVPTSSFFQTLTESKLDKDENIIVYCHVGSRSAHCQRILNDMGYTKVSNLAHGIVSYSGEIVRG